MNSRELPSGERCCASRAAAEWLKEQGRLLGTPGVAADIACGEGENLLWLAEQGWRGIGADKDRSVLETARTRDAKGRCVWIEADFERGWPLRAESVDLLVVFRYLQRDLFPQLLAAVRPGGMAIYETFTVDQPRFGRPRNPDFLLKPGELRERFSGWRVIAEREGVVEGRMAAASIAARKPG